MLYDNLVQSYGRHISFLEFMGIKRAIKKVHDGHIPLRLVGPIMQPALETVLSVKNGCRLYYKTLFESKYVAKNIPLKSEEKWNRELDKNIQWKEQYERFASCTKNTTLLWFQDKLMHRILTTNTFIAKFTEDSPLCTFCNNDRETLLHLFVTCPQVIGIWNNIEDLIRSRLGMNMTLNKEKIIMGLGKNQSMPAQEVAAIQRLLLLTKYYIYRTKAAKGSLNVDSMKVFIKFNTLAELSSTKDGSNTSEQRQNDVHKKLCG